MASKHEPISLGSPSFTTVDLPALRISDVWFPPGADLAAHTHERPVFAVALEGSIDSRMERHTLECDRSCVWTEPAGETHENRVGPEGARVLVLLPDPTRRRLMGPCAPLLDEVHHFRHGGVEDLGRRMRRELAREDDDVARLTLQGLALETLALGLGLSGRGVGAGAFPPWLERARDLVHDRFREGLEIAEIADAVGVDAGTLARAFRRRFRVPIGTYQRRLRLDWAAEALADTEIPLGIVALRAGFYDQSHLTRHFRRHTGRTPGEYRRLHRR